MGGALPHSRNCLLDGPRTLPCRRYSDAWRGSCNHRRGDVWPGRIGAGHRSMEDRQRRVRGAVVVPVFRCADAGKADEIQATIISTLQNHLTPDEMKAVRAIPAIVGRADRDFAARLCKRLRAFLVLQGDIREGPEGRWSVYAGVCQRLGSTVTHIDLHTRDRTPAKADWRWAFRRLTGVDEIPQREYPLEFADGSAP